MRLLLLSGTIALIGCADHSSHPSLPEGLPNDDAALRDDSSQGTPTSDADTTAVEDASALLDGGDGGSNSAVDAAAVTVKVLRDGANDAGVRYQLLEIKQEPKAPTYAQWFPPPDGGARPVVVLTKPYDGIDWTGQEVDQRWAKQGQGLFLDVDGPGPDAGTADAGVRSSIAYQALPPDNVQDYWLYGSLHNFGTLLLYGRFYAGGDVQNDIDDMTLGLEWLAQAPNVDKKRIGIFGGSWGGFEALYGAAYAREEVRPSVGVALSPLVDFEREVEFVTRDVPAKYNWQSSRDACATFFDPYLRRTEASRARRGSYVGLRAQDLADRIKVPFLLLHEDWDTLTAFDASKNLTELAPTVFKPMWLLHSAPPGFPLNWDGVVNSHGALMAGWGGAVSSTFALSFLVRNLGDADQTLYTIWPTNEIRALFAHIHQLQRDKVDVTFFAARLRELTDKRLFAVDGNTGNWTLTGAQAVADEVNREWGTKFTAANIDAELTKGLPAP